MFANFSIASQFCSTLLIICMYKMNRIELNDFWVHLVISSVTVKVKNLLL